MSTPPRHLTSRDNLHFKALKKAVLDNSAYKKTGWVWLEGDHLCRAALQRGCEVLEWVFSESFWAKSAGNAEFFAMKNAANHSQTTLLPAELLSQLCTQEPHAQVACRVALPRPANAPTLQASLVLDRVQDAGNVGAMLRCAAAFGYRQVLALQGSAALWSPKVLRAAMGAHFGLSLHEGLQVADVQQLGAGGLALVATSSHAGGLLHQTSLPSPHAWLMGNEGEGLGAALAALSTHQVRIAQPGGEESLNVATAAAICMHHGAVGS
jgi:RNA methyltransferase, TrmH family